MVFAVGELFQQSLNTFIAKGKDLRIEQYALYDTNLRVVFIDNSAKYQSNTFPPNTIKAHNQFLYNQYRLFTVFPSEYYFLNMSLAVVTEVLLLIVLIYFCMWVVSYTMFRFGRRNSYTYSRYCKDFCKRIVERTYLSDLHLKKQKSPFFVIVYGIITYSFFVLFLIVSEVIAKATFIYWGMPGAFGLLLSSFLFLAITVILLKLFFKIREKQIQVIGTRKDIDIRVKHYRCGGEHHEYQCIRSNQKWLRCYRNCFLTCCYEIGLVQEPVPVLYRRTVHENKISVDFPYSPFYHWDISPNANRIAVVTEGVIAIYHLQLCYEEIQISVKGEGDVRGVHWLENDLIAVIRGTELSVFCLAKQSYHTVTTLSVSQKNSAIVYHQEYHIMYYFSDNALHAYSVRNNKQCFTLPIPIHEGVCVGICDNNKSIFVYVERYSFSVYEALSGSFVRTMPILKKRKYFDTVSKTLSRVY